MLDWEDIEEQEILVENLEEQIKLDKLRERQEEILVE